MWKTSGKIQVSHPTANVQFRPMVTKAVPKATEFKSEIQQASVVPQQQLNQQELNNENVEPVEDLE
jgi:hypothetical protein